MALNKQLISALYVAVYGRAPDSSGLRYWVSELNGGAAYHNIASGFMQHPLFDHFYGHLNYDGLIRAFYENILGGKGDTGGINYWVGRLQKGEATSEVLASFLEASLNTDLTKQGNLSHAEWLAAIDRQKILENKVDVGIYFAEHLGAGSNMQGEVNSLAVQNEARYIAARDILKNVTAARSSVDSLKNFIKTNYKHEPETSENDFAGWDGWFAAYLDKLLNGDWNGAMAILDGLGLDDTTELDWSGLESLYGDGSNLNFGGMDWDAFYGNLNNWNGSDLDFLSVYWEFILSWISQLGALDGGAAWGANDLSNFYADLGISMDQLGLLGQYDASMFDAEFWG